MGGAVRVVIRKEDSEVLSFVSWTNSIAHVLKSPEFLSGDLSGIVEHMDYYAKLQEDYKKNKDSGNFEERNTFIYGKYKFDEIFPVEYGIIVVDFKDKKIYSCQDYTNLESHYAAFMRSNDGEPSFLHHSEKEVKELIHMADLNLFHSASVYFDDDWHEIEFSPELDYISIIKTVNKALDGKDCGYNIDRNNLISFNLNIKSSFKVEKYTNTNQLLNDIQSAGFVISEKDLMEWESFGNRYEEDE